MLTIEWFKGKRVTVMGLGLHGGGLAASRWLLRHGAAVTVTDLKDRHALELPIAELEKERVAIEKRGEEASLRFVLGSHEEADFTGVDLVLQNPGVSRENKFLGLAASAGVPVGSDISIFFSLCPYPIAGITGTKGKTTTSALLGAMCSVKDKRTVVAGNNRVPVLDLLDEVLASPGALPIVLELSSWQLEGLGRQKHGPHVAVITNVKPDHLNRYRDMDDYAAAKRLIVEFQGEDDFAVLNRDDERVRAMSEGVKARVLWFSTSVFYRGDGCFLRGEDIVLRWQGRDRDVLRKGDIRLKGEHNIPNVLAACAAAAALGIDHKAIRSAVRAFVGVPGRLEEIAVIDGVTYVNDTTATAPDASVAALRTYNPGMIRRTVLIAGGADKALDFDAWAKEASRRAKHLVLFPGSATEKMMTSLEVTGAVSVSPVSSMKEAVGEAQRHAVAGDVVLLSPGCASFGAFQHEFDRGDQFSAEVAALVSAGRSRTRPTLRRRGA